MADGPWTKYQSDPDDQPASGPWTKYQAAPSDAPKAVSWGPPSAWQDNIARDLKHSAGLAGRMVVDTAAALPMMAMDMGVAGRNVIGNEVNKVIGNPATPDYELPSADWNRQMDKVFGRPENTVEKIASVAGPMILGGMAGAENAPSFIKNMLSPAVKTPSNFISPDQSKAQHLAKSINEAQEAGYVIPPATTNPSFKNALVETVAGKISTQQGASVKNQAITNQLASKAIGLNPDAPITLDALQAVRAEAGKAYENVRSAGEIMTDSKFQHTLNGVQDRLTGAEQSFPGTKPSPLLDEIQSISVPKFDASHAVDKIKMLRDQASVAYRQGDAGLGQGYKGLATALEDQMDRALSIKQRLTNASLTKGGVTDDMVKGFRNARQTIAKAHTIEEALNPSTGDVSTMVLARALRRGEPLSGELRTAANFGNSFEKAAQSPSKIGSAGVNHLMTYGSGLVGVLGEQATGSPWGLAAAAAVPLARSAAKAYALGPGQSGAIPQIARAIIPIAARLSAMTQAPSAGQRMLQNFPGPQTQNFLAQGIRNSLATQTAIQQ